MTSGDAREKRETPEELATKFAHRYGHEATARECWAFTTDNGQHSADCQAATNTIYDAVLPLFKAIEPFAELGIGLDPKWDDERRMVTLTTDFGSIRCKHARAALKAGASQ